MHGDSMWIPYGFHGIFSFHMESIWIPYGIWGQGKVLHKLPCSKNYLVPCTLTIHTLKHMYIQYYKTFTTCPCSSLCLSSFHYKATRSSLIHCSTHLPHLHMSSMQPIPLNPS